MADRTRADVDTVGTHPIFDRFTPWRGVTPPGYLTNWLGVRTATAFAVGMSEPPTGEIVSDYPQADEEIFEWIDLLETVAAADGTFTMVELGAGYGRWVTNAAAACRALGTAYRLVGVEAEPTHFAWMLEHLERNDVDLSAVSAIPAAVAAADGRVRFRVGAAADCYGQRIVRSRGERADWRRNWRGRNRRVRALSLESVLHEARIDGIVDLIDLDVQSAEADVLEPAVALLDARVRRVHVGTHDPRENEERVRALFGRLGWECLADYAYSSASATPYGAIAFEDGVQSWRNPRL
jgi:FkbM family methyltransferase